MTPIAKIEIAIPIPIFVRNCDRDPDLNLKSLMRCDRDRGIGERRSFGRSFKKIHARMLLEKRTIKTF